MNGVYTELRVVNYMEVAYAGNSGGENVSGDEITVL